MSKPASVLVPCAALLVTSCAHTAADPDGSGPLVAHPIVIAHRGASGYLPEHTLAAYEKAIEMRADYIELDLVATKDGELIVRHENEMSETSDVAEKFPSRKTRKTIDGHEHVGFFSEDFTLAEIRKLKAKERLQTRAQENNGKYGIPSLKEVIALVKQKEKELGRPIGLYIETKHPSYHQFLNLALEPRLVKILEDAGLNRADAPVYVQSFEVSNLKALSKLLRVPLIQLLDGPSERPYDLILAKDMRSYFDLTQEEGLKEIASYAQGIGPWKELIRPLQPSSTALTAPMTDLVKRAHAHGLLVHPYTFRSDRGVLPELYDGRPGTEYEAFFTEGVDGVFTDFPDHAIAVRDRLFPLRSVAPELSERVPE